MGWGVHQGTLSGSQWVMKDREERKKEASWIIKDVQERNEREGKTFFYNTLHFLGEVQCNEVIFV
jgi:hypothetical protein